MVDVPRWFAKLLCSLVYFPDNFLTENRLPIPSSGLSAAIPLLVPTSAKSYAFNIKLWTRLKPQKSLWLAVSCRSTRIGSIRLRISNEKGAPLRVPLDLLTGWSGRRLNPVEPELRVQGFLEAHTAHTPHTAHVRRAAAHGFFLFRLLSDHSFGRDQKAGNRCCVLQRGTDNLGRIDNARLDQVSYLSVCAL